MIRKCEAQPNYSYVSLILFLFKNLVYYYFYITVSLGNKFISISVIESRDTLKQENLLF